jgi:hypothetical protein
MRVARRFFQKLVLAIGLGVLPGISVSEELNCPSSLQETPAATTDDPRWVLVTPAGRRSLDRVNLYVGNPPELSKMVPPSTRKIVGGTETFTWELLRSSTPTYWVGCTYVNTTAVLFRRVDTSASRCVAMFDVSRSGGVSLFNSMVCK